MDEKMEELNWRMDSPFNQSLTRHKKFDKPLKLPQTPSQDYFNRDLDYNQCSYLTPEPPSPVSSSSSRWSDMGSGISIFSDGGSSSSESSTAFSVRGVRKLSRSGVGEYKYEVVTPTSSSPSLSPSNSVVRPTDRSNLFIHTNSPFQSKHAAAADSSKLFIYTNSPIQFTPTDANALLDSPSISNCSTVSLCPSLSTSPITPEPSPAPFVEKPRPIIPRRKPVKKRNQEQHVSTFQKIQSELYGIMDGNSPICPDDIDQFSIMASEPSPPPSPAQEPVSPITSPISTCNLSHTLTLSSRLPTRKPLSRSPSKQQLSLITPLSISKVRKSPLLSLTSDDVLLQIMSHLPNMKEIYNFALVHWRIDDLVKSEQSYLLRIMLQKNIPSAFNVLQKRNPEATTAQEYITAYKSCDSIIKSLLSRVRERCRGFLSPKLLDTANIQAQKRMERSLWQIWDFTYTFGNNTKSIRDLEAQEKWLYETCDKDDILSIMEMLGCLQVLVAPVYEKTFGALSADTDVAIKTALKFGVVNLEGFIDAELMDSKAIETLENFSKYIIMLGPQYIYIIEGYLAGSENYDAKLEKVYQWLQSVDALKNWDSKMTTLKDEANMYEAFLRHPARTVFRELDMAARTPQVIHGWGDHNLKD